MVAESTFLSHLKIPSDSPPHKTTRILYNINIVFIFAKKMLYDV
jgi:hypothetical protein